MATRKPLSAGAQRALTLVDDCTAFHDRFVEGYRRRHRAFLGMLESDSEAAAWVSKRHPPYVNHIVETTLAGILDDRLVYRVRPRPRFYNSAEEVESARKGAEAHEILHNAQLEQDYFAEKQRPFVLQNAVAGVTAMKTYWSTRERVSKRLEVVDVGAEQGMPGQLFDLREVKAKVTDYDGPCSEVVNIEDLFWHESAVDIQRSPVVAHRTYMHINELRQLERDGVYKNVADLGETQGASSAEQVVSTDGTRRRDRDMVEVLEVWYRAEGGIRVATVGNRSVELRSDRENPFWHGEYPFVTCSTHPGLFSVAGMSQVEKIMDLQTAVWDLTNQTHDNVRLMNNFVVAFNPMLVDPDACEHEPGARWPVEGPLNEAIQKFEPSPLVSEIALPHIARMQSDMQNIAGSSPFTSTSEARNQGANTATEAALVTNLAAQASGMVRQQLAYAYKRIGQQRTELNQQFIRKPLLVEQLGLDMESEFVEIAPQLLVGSYEFTIDMVSESQARAERRAEANGFFQTFLQALPAWVALAAKGGATAPNFDAAVKRWLEGFELEPAVFFSEKPIQAEVPQGQQAQGQGGNGGGNGAPPGPGGVTGPGSIDPAVSPSAQASLSPETFMQRLGAMSGGSANT